MLSCKTCNNCGVEKLLSEFSKDKGKKDGLSTHCRDCMNKNNKAWRLQNPEKAKESHRNWRKNNMAHKREKNREWYAANKLKVKRWFVENADRVRNIKRKWIALNKEKQYANNNRWRAKNPEKTLEYARNNRDKRRRNSVGRITSKEWQALKEFYNFVCLACRRKEPEIKLTLDHVVPLIAGGSNTIDNAQPLCRSCNSRKGIVHKDYRKVEQEC